MPNETKSFVGLVYGAFFMFSPCEVLADSYTQIFAAFYYIKWVATNLLVCLDDMSSVGTDPNDCISRGGISFARFLPTSPGLIDLPVRGLSLGLSECVYKVDSHLQITWHLRGPRTVPWGTPESTSTSVDLVPSSRTDCFRSKNDSVHRRVDLRIP